MDIPHPETRMASDGLVSIAVRAAIVSVIGALASLLVERAWRRRKAKQKDKARERRSSMSRGAIGVRDIRTIRARPIVIDCVINERRLH